MAKIKLNFARLPIPEKTARTKQIVAALTGNASFTTPSPPLATISAAMTALDTAYSEAQTARQTAKEKTSAQNEKEDELNQLMSQLASYVESVAGNDEEMILGAGMDTREKSVAASESPAQPLALAASAGDHDGEIDLAWDKVAGSKSYVVEKSADPPTQTSWSHAGVGTKSGMTITGLTSGTRYWFRVAAVNNNGQSGWSDPAMKIAP
jgi:hypothetical protein